MNADERNTGGRLYGRVKAGCEISVFLTAKAVEDLTGTYRMSSAKLEICAGQVICVLCAVKLQWEIEAEGNKFRST